ncbi:MAG: phosphatase PAP2 family protein, partial [Oscillospiraceae bacterium]|nr:phosphatase PAP2 family protein [Oscillospiraceae bacterium]
GIGALVIAALVGFSRMYLYVHFPTDVLVGVIVGLIAGRLACAVINYLFKNKEI